MPGGKRLVLTAAEARLERIRNGEAELKAFLDRLDKIDREEKDPRRKRWLEQLETGRQLENAAEFDEAIALYRTMLKEGIDNADLRRQLEEKLRKLEAAWKPRGPEHARARALIYKVWPKLDNAGLKARLPEARKAFEECKRVGDRVALQRLYKATEAHGHRLGKELSTLNPRLKEEDEKPAELIKEINAGLAQLARDVDEYLTGDAPDNP
jgi:hypothetical protein